MIGIHPADLPMRLEDVLDPALEHQRVLGEGEGSVHHSAGSIVEERHQDRLSLATLGVGHHHGVQPINLHALQRGGEVEGQCFLPIMLAQASLSIQSRGAHQARQMRNWTVGIGFGPRPGVSSGLLWR